MPLFNFRFKRPPKLITNPISLVIQKELKSFLAKNRIPGASMQLYIAGVPHEYYFGYQELEKRIPVSDKTIFEIGSLTKIFTSLLLIKQVLSGKLKLSDSIINYTATRPLSETMQQISFIDLLTHSSSLPFNLPGCDYEVADCAENRALLASFLSHWNNKDEVGSVWFYSNLGFGLLGMILSSYLQNSYAALIQEHILTPLQMDNTGLEISKYFSEHYALGYPYKSSKAAQIILPGLFQSAGGLRTSGKDMLRFLAAVLGLPETPPEIRRAMELSQSAYIQLPENNQGLSWSIYPFISHSKKSLLKPPRAPNFGPISIQSVISNPTFDGNCLIEKTGGTDGFRSYIGVIPKYQSGIVLMLNRYIASGDMLYVVRKILFHLTKSLEDN